ncbi:MAG: hypothetical protein ONB16_08285 [candidate division KSB1 bacterium]|nr:hypothetical protein [candidate division KSB1 bacterium]
MQAFRISKIIVAMGLMTLIHCAIFRPSQQSQDRLKIEIIKGKTTETAILHSLGLPTATSTNNVGDEVWTYHHVSYFTTAGSNPTSLIIWEMSTGAPNENTDPFDLVITFDQNDVVKDIQVAPPMP